jgi:hypothetical protein
MPKITCVKKTGTLYHASTNRSNAPVGFQAQRCLEKCRAVRNWSADWGRKVFFLVVREDDLLPTKRGTLVPRFRFRFGEPTLNCLLSVLGTFGSGNPYRQGTTDKELQTRNYRQGTTDKELQTVVKESICLCCYSYGQVFTVPLFAVPLSIVYTRGCVKPLWWLW